MARDDAAIVPLILEARRLNPRLGVIATPWSPPAWMKSSRSLIGGTLEREAYEPYARYVTECSGGGWSTDFAANLRWGVHSLIVEAVRHEAGAVLLWNMALDQSSGPTNGGCQDCRGVVTVDTRTGRVEYNVEHYVLGHASKFVAPGAVRLASTSNDGSIENVAFRNRDGTHVLVVLNSAHEARAFDVSSSNRSFRYRLPPGAVATFRWT